MTKHFARPSRSARFVLVAALAAVVGGCAELEKIQLPGLPALSGGPQIPVRVMNTPRVAEAAAYRRVAVAGFERDQQLLLTRELEAALGRATVGGRQAYEIVPSAQVAPLLRGQAFADARGREIVAQTRADAVFHGDATYTMNRRPYQTTERKCVQENPNASRRVLDFGGNCLRYQDVRVQCTEAEAVVTATLRVYDTRKLANVFSDRVEGRASESACGANARRNEQQLTAEAAKTAAERMRALVAAGETVVQVRLMSESDGEMSPNARQDFMNGLEFARGNRVDAACERFEAAFNTEKGRSVPVVYNWAVCLEAQGQLLEANEQYGIAERAAGKPVRLVTDGLNRTQGASASRDLLKQQRPDLVPGRRSEATPGPAVTATPTVPAVTSPAPTREPPVGTPVVSAPTTAPVVSSGAVTPELLRVMSTERRVALVVGNARYRDASQVLRNPVNDADAMRQQLLRLRFDVVVVRDGSLAELDRALAEFAQKAAGAGVALFYYSGHGYEDERDNWLVPVEFDFRNRGPIGTRAVAVERIVSTIAAAGPRVGLAIVDACALPWSVTRARAPSAPPAGTLVAWATSPGGAADDNRNRQNGFYTERLLRRIATPNLPVEQLLESVGQEVARDSNQTQRPWVAAQLRSPLYFNVAAR